MAFDNLATILLCLYKSHLLGIRMTFYYLLGRRRQK